MAETHRLHAPAETMHLEELLATIESMTGLEVSIYPAKSRPVAVSIDALPVGYRRHMSEFCRLVKGREELRGCGGHDAVETNQRAANVGRPFVQQCHAGIAEVIVPVFGQSGHLATVFVGQVVTEAVEREGFDGIWKRVRDRQIDRAKMKRVFAALPKMPERELLQIGRLVECATQGLVAQMSAEMFERQVRIQGCPQVRNALRIFQEEHCWNITQAEMARRVHASTAYFSRLFKRVVGHTFSDYLTHLRIREAQTLLHLTLLPVSTIAETLGYSRQSYFTRRFRDVVGMTPSEYRRNGGGHPAASGPPRTTRTFTS